MKRFEELNDLEISNLSNEDIERYANIECMNEGDAILPNMPISPTDSLIKINPTEEAYEIDIRFFTKDLEVVSMLKKSLELVSEYYSTGYDYSIGSDYIYLKKSEKKEYPTNTRVEKKLFYDKSELDINQLKLKIANEQIQKYKKEKDFYDKVYKDRSKIINKIYEEIERVNYEIKDLESAKEKYKTYLELAENEEDAKKFFKLALPDDYQLLKEKIWEVE